MPYLEIGTIGEDGITLEVARREVGFTGRGIDDFCEHLRAICRDGARVHYCYVGVDSIDARLRSPYIEIAEEGQG